MKSLLVLISALTLAAHTDAQRLRLNLFGGMANYAGDLQNNPMKNPNAAFGIGLGYDISDHFIIRAGYTTGKISGDDKGGKYAFRNLNFTSGIKEGHVAIEYNLWSTYDHFFTPYVFAGVARYKYNPYTYDPDGKKVFLKPLSTEGQGFIPGRTEYELSQFSIPFGTGFKLSFSDSYSIGLEIGLRKTNNDYLDDVSTTYVDEAELLINRGPKAVQLAYRGDEVKNPQPYPNNTYPRGGKNKDWYYFSGLTASFRLGGGGGADRGVGCPRVY